VLTHGGCGRKRFGVYSLAGRVGSNEIVSGRIFEFRRRFRLDTQRLDELFALATLIAGGQTK
jgi:hypothetical protein